MTQKFYLQESTLQKCKHMLPKMDRECSGQFYRKKEGRCLGSLHQRMIWDIKKKRETFTYTDKRVLARSLLWTECLCSSKLIYENPDSQCDGIGRQGLWEVIRSCPWSSPHGISAFVSEIGGSLLPFSALPVRAQREGGLL